MHNCTQLLPAAHRPVCAQLNRACGTTHGLLMPFDHLGGQPATLTRIRLQAVPPPAPSRLTHRCMLRPLSPVQIISYSLLALNLLVASDVIETLVRPSHEQHMDALYKLGIVVGMRTVLAYFLGKEAEEVQHTLVSTGPKGGRHTV